MRIKNQKDFWAGVMFTAFGAFFAGIGSRYEIGSAEQMGPGYFPTALGVIVLTLGLLIMATGLSSRATEDNIAGFDWKVLGLILGPIALFGLLLRPLGLVGSIFLLVAIASYASHEFTWKGALANALIMIALCLSIFVWGLGLQFPLWPELITG